MIALSLMPNEPLPHLGPHHPAGLAFRALNEASQIVLGQLDQIAAGDTLHAADLIRVRALLEEGVNQIAAFYFLHIRAEREALAEKRCNERLEAINTRLVTQHNLARATAQVLVTQLAALPLTPDSFQRPRGASPETA